MSFLVRVWSVDIRKLSGSFSEERWYISLQISGKFSVQSHWPKLCHVPMLEAVTLAWGRDNNSFPACSMSRTRCGMKHAGNSGQDVNSRMGLLAATKRPRDGEMEVRVLTTISMKITLRIKSSSLWLWLFKFCVPEILRKHFWGCEQDTQPQPVLNTHTFNKGSSDWWTPEKY